MAARLMKLAVDAVSNGSHTLMGGMTTEVSGATSPGSTEAVTEAIPAQPQNSVVTESKVRSRRPSKTVASTTRDRDRYERKKAQLIDCDAKLERTERALETAKRELRAERGRSQALAVERDGLRIQLSESGNALEHERRVRASKEELLVKRTAELDAANAFLPAAETITDTHIIGLFEALNYEISQSATILAEAYENATRAQVQTSQLKMQPEVQGTLRLLRLPPNSAIDSTTALQIGLQAALVNNSVGFLRHGVYKEAKALRPVLAALKEREPEQVANKWSALAHQYTRIGAKEHSEQQVMHHMASLLGDALAVSGYNDGVADSPASTSSERVLAKAQDPLLGMARLLIELDIILGEKVAVGWMEGFAVAPGAPFRKEVMEAAFQGDKSTGKERVICCTALGLRRIVKGHRTDLLKPMVALSSLLPVTAPPPGLGPAPKAVVVEHT